MGWICECGAENPHDIAYCQGCGKLLRPRGMGSSDGSLPQQSDPRSGVADLLNPEDEPTLTSLRAPVLVEDEEPDALLLQDVGRKSLAYLLLSLIALLLVCIAIALWRIALRA